MKPIVFAAALVLAAVPVHAQELIVNGGFETGNFSGWTQFGNTGSTGVSTLPFDGVLPAGGSFQAFLGPAGTSGGIQQTVSTVVGQAYTFRFDLAGLGSSGVRSFSADFGGTTVQSLVNPASFLYTANSYSVVATGTSTDVIFRFRNDPNFFLLDIVSVQASNVSLVPEPSTYALMLGGLGMLGIAARRRRAQLNS